MKSRFPEKNNLCKNSNSHLINEESVRIREIKGLNPATDSSVICAIMKDFLSLNLNGFVWSNHTVHFNLKHFKNHRTIAYKCPLSAGRRISCLARMTKRSIIGTIKGTVHGTMIFWNGSFVFVSCNGFILTFHFIIKHFNSSYISSSVFLKIIWSWIPNWIKEYFFFNFKSRVDIYTILNTILKWSL